MSQFDATFDQHINFLRALFLASRDRSQHRQCPGSQPPASQNFKKRGQLSACGSGVNQEQNTPCSVEMNRGMAYIVVIGAEG